jgi:hypothetical protein
MGNRSRPGKLAEKCEKFKSGHNKNLKQKNARFFGRRADEIANLMHPV